MGMIEKDFMRIWEKLSGYYDDKRPAGVAKAYYDSFKTYPLHVVNEAADLVIQSERGFGRVPDIHKILPYILGVLEREKTKKVERPEYYQNVLEREREIQANIHNCPDAISKWNHGFYGVINRLLKKKQKGWEFTEGDIQEIIEWWDYRKKLEDETDCPEFWCFSWHYFKQTIAEIDTELAEYIPAPEPQPEEVGEPSDVPF